MGSFITSTKPNTSYGGHGAPVSFGSYIASPSTSTSGGASSLDWKVALLIGAVIYAAVKVA